MIRVLNIIDTMGSGGVERRRLSMAKLLDKSKFELKIICTNAVGDFPEEFKKHNIEIIEIGDLKSFLDIKQHKKVIKVINDFKPHIIHGAVFEGVTMAAINGFYKRVPIIILEETSDPVNRRWKGNLLMKLFCSISNKVIGVSPSATNYLENKISVAKNKVVLINNGVVIPEIVSEEIKSQLKQKHTILSDDIVIGSVGRMSSDAHKRFSDLINAVAILIKKNNKIKLILVGDGPEKSNYEKLVKELDIQNNVIFAGYQNNIGNYYSIFDIFSLTSAYEAFGLVLAEAMLHKLPVVATNVGGMKHVVVPNETGFLIDKFDVNSISNSIEKLVLDENLRIKFGNNGYQVAMKKYTEQSYIKNVSNLYELLYINYKNK